MANQSYICGVDAFPSQPLLVETEEISLYSSCNYTIPLLFKLLVSGNTQRCHSALFEEREHVALCGDFQAGLDRLRLFWQELSQKKLFPERSLEKHIRLTEKFFSSVPKRKFFILECAEIFAMDFGESPELQTQALLNAVLDIDSEIETFYRQIIACPEEKDQLLGICSWEHEILKPEPLVPQTVDITRPLCSGTEAKSGMNWETLSKITPHMPMEEVFETVGKPMFPLTNDPPSPYNNPVYYMGNGFLVAVGNTKLPAHIESNTNAWKFYEECEPHAVGLYYFAKLEYLTEHFHMLDPLPPFDGNDFYSDFEILEGLHSGDSFERFSNHLKLVRDRGEFYTKGESRRLNPELEFVFSNTWIWYGQWQFAFYGKSKKTRLGSFERNFGMLTYGRKLTLQDYLNEKG